MLGSLQKNLYICCRFIFVNIFYLNNLQQMNENDRKQQEPQFQMNLKPEIASGEYSNFALISHSHSDFVIDFARVLPGMPKPEVCSRVILAPEHAKRLLGALQENIYKYEQEFGKIELPNQPQRTIAPFGGGRGEA